MSTTSYIKVGITLDTLDRVDTKQEKPKILLPTAEERLTNPSLVLKQAVLGERDSENRLKKKQPIVRGEEWIVKREGDKVTTKTGEAMFQCPHCKAQDKPMSFSSEHDLTLHIKAWHGGYPDYVR